MKVHWLKQASTDEHLLIFSLIPGYLWPLRQQILSALSPKVSPKITNVPASLLPSHDQLLPGQHPRAPNRSLLARPLLLTTVTVVSATPTSGHITPQLNTVQEALQGLGKERPSVLWLWPLGTFSPVH